MRTLLLLLLWPLAMPLWARPIGVLETGRPVAAWPLDRYLEEKMGVPFDGSSPYLVVELEGGTLALFRSEPEEPWGSQAEVAGYRLACRLGYPDLVPETVVRKLGRSDLPEGMWPYQEPSRLGSLQLFLPARPAKAEEVAAMPAERHAAMEILTFVIGRYDNHLGNTLVDGQGRVFMVDFENALEYQRARFGEYAFVRKGQGNYELSSPGKSEPFPYHQAQVLERPSLEQMRTRLEPYWAPWAGSIEGLHKMVTNSRDGCLRSVVWDNHLWLQIQVSSRHPAYTTDFPEPLMSSLATLNDDELMDEILLPPFTESHARDMLQRRDQVLQAAKR